MDPGHRVSLLPLVGLALVIGACFDPIVGGEPVLSCGADGDCPEGLTCNAFTARCVAVDAVAARPPALVGEAVFTPAEGVHGDRFTVTFTLDADVLGDPDVVIDVGDRRLQWQLDPTTDRLARRWVFTLQPDTSVPLGRATVQAGFIATDGVPAPAVILGGIALVATPPPPPPATPALVGEASVSPALGDASAVFVASFTLDSDVAGEPAVFITVDGAERRFEVDDAGTDRAGRRWVFALPPSSAIPDGEHLVRARLAARGGDDVTLELGRFLKDGSGPVASVTLEPALIGVGGRSRLSVVPSEPLASTPTLVFRDGIDPGFLLVTDSPSLLVWELEVRCPGAGCLPADGRYLLDELIVDDAAGNTRRIRPAGLAVTVDSRAPRVVALDLPRQRFSEVAGFDEVSLTFLVDEAVRDDAVSVRLDGLALACTTSLVQGVQQRVCVGDVRPGIVEEGDRVLTVSVSDDAGNVGVASAPVQVDFSPPRVVPGSASLERVAPAGGLPIAGSELVTPGTTLTVTFAVDEGVSAPPVAEAVPAGTPLDLPGLGAVPLPSLELLGQRLSRHQQVLTSATAGGDYVVRATFADLVGHQTTAFVGLDFGFARVVESPCPAAACVDVDGDGQVGFSANCQVGIDCDDSNPSAFVGAPEFPGDALDNDCAGDGDAPVDESVGWFFDPAAPPGAPGTRAAPSSQFPPAGFDVIFMAEGVAPVGVPPGDVVVVGGFDRSTWTRRPGARTRLQGPGTPRGLMGVSIAQASLSETVIIDSAVAGFVDGCVIVDSGAVDDGGLGFGDVLNVDGGRIIGGDFSNLQLAGATTVIRTRANLLGVLIDSTSTVVSSILDGASNAGTLVVLHSRVGSNEQRRAVIEGNSDQTTVANSLLRAASPSMAVFERRPVSLRGSAVLGTRQVEGTTFNTFDTLGPPPAFFGNFFVDDANVIDGVHILPTSPLVNRGVSITDPLGAATADIDGDCRLGPPDVGPDEAG